ncbi:hypothetical protein BVY04_03805 [bacterium M21]|nr:hypothetical protein BVY04_03805 [bacterium M21]
MLLSKLTILVGLLLVGCAGPRIRGKFVRIERLHGVEYNRASVGIEAPAKFIFQRLSDSIQTRSDLKVIKRNKDAQVIIVHKDGKSMVFTVHPELESESTLFVSTRINRGESASMGVIISEVKQFCQKNEMNDEVMEGK